MKGLYRGPEKNVLALKTAMDAKTFLSVSRCIIDLAIIVAQAHNPSKPSPQEMPAEREAGEGMAYVSQIELGCRRLLKAQHGTRRRRVCSGP
jgi:hypothetical protein